MGNGSDLDETGSSEDRQTERLTEHQRTDDEEEEDATSKKCHVLVLHDD